MKIVLKCNEILSEIFLDIGITKMVWYILNNKLLLNLYQLIFLSKIHK